MIDYWDFDREKFDNIFDHICDKVEERAGRDAVEMNIESILGAVITIMYGVSD